MRPLDYCVMILSKWQLMKLSKIQKFLKEHNINYELHINKYGNNEFDDIDIKDNKTNYTKISEIAENRGKTVSGIMLFYRNIKTKSSYSIPFSSQNEIIQKLKDDITKIREGN